MSIRLNILQLKLGCFARMQVLVYVNITSSTSINRVVWNNHHFNTYLKLSIFMQQNGVLKAHSDSA